MAQGMKRLGTPIAALLGLVLIALIATSWLINRDALRIYDRYLFPASRMIDYAARHVLGKNVLLVAERTT